MVYLHLRLVELLRLRARMQFLLWSESQSQSQQRLLWYRVGTWFVLVWFRLSEHPTLVRLGGLAGAAGGGVWVAPSEHVTLHAVVFGFLRRCRWRRVIAAEDVVGGWRPRAWGRRCDLRSNTGAKDITRSSTRGPQHSVIEWVTIFTRSSTRGLINQ